MARTISALTAQKRNPQRINVYLDGEFAFGLARIVAAWLSIGQELSDEKIAELQAQDAQEVAYARALRLLEVRARSGAEIRTRLKDAGVLDETIAQVLERLERSGLVDDTRFAQSWVENRSEMRPRSRRALAYELRQRGVDRETIERSLEDLDEEALAVEAALRHSRKLAGLEWPDFRQKMYAFLARRGFNYETSGPAARRAWQDLHNENEEEEEV